MLQCARNLTFTTAGLYVQGPRVSIDCLSGNFPYAVATRSLFIPGVRNVRFDQLDVQPGQRFLRKELALKWPFVVRPRASFE
jgi:hypothetical protein